MAPGRDHEGKIRQGVRQLPRDLPIAHQAIGEIFDRQLPAWQDFRPESNVFAM